jgi:soluble P-type ATPase
MLSVLRPGQDPLEIDSIFVDFEGTLAADGRVHPKAKEKINLLSKRTRICLFAKGDRGTCEKSLRKIRAEIVYLAEGTASMQKIDRLRAAGPKRTIVIGNGLDDVQALEEAGLGICVIGKEGASGEAMKQADLVVLNVMDALDFLLKPLRQKATLEK